MYFLEDKKSVGGAEEGAMVTVDSFGADGPPFIY